MFTQCCKKYTPLVVSIAKKHNRPGLSLQDLVQEGFLGLLQASRTFDPSYNKSFQAYAKWWIKSYIQLFILKNYSIVSYGQSSGNKKSFFSLPSNNSDNDKPNPGDAQDLAQISPQLCKNTEPSNADFSNNESSMRLKQIDTSLDVNYENFLSCDEPSPELNAIINENYKRLHNALKHAMKHLNEREKKIIRQRYLRDKPETLEKIGKKLNLTKERIRQLEKGALAKLNPFLSGFEKDYF